MSVEKFVRFCRNGNLPQMKVMLRQNPDLINDKNEIGRTGLMVAAYAGRTQVAEVLLQMQGKTLEQGLQK